MFYGFYTLLFQFIEHDISNLGRADGSSAQEVVGCPLKIGRDEASLFSLGAADKLGDASLALLILSSWSCLPECVIKFCDVAYKPVFAWSWDGLGIKAITAERKGTSSWTVYALTPDIAKAAAAVAGDISATAAYPNGWISGMEIWSWRLVSRGSRACASLARLGWTLIA